MSMKLKVIYLTLVLVLVGIVGVGNLEASSMASGAKSDAVKEKTIAALEAYWNILLTGEPKLEQIYDLTGSEAVKNMEEMKSRIIRHYLDPAKRAGFKYTSMKVIPFFESVELSDAIVKVRVRVNLEYTSQYPNSTETIVTKEADIPYELIFIERDNAWKLTHLSSSDAFSKRGNMKVLNSTEQWQESSLILNKNEDVGINGFYIYYDRSGAAACTIL